MRHGFASKFIEVTGRPLTSIGKHEESESVGRIGGEFAGRGMLQSGIYGSALSDARFTIRLRRFYNRLAVLLILLAAAFAAVAAYTDRKWAVAAAAALAVLAGGAALLPRLNR
ncbi:MAG TPA: hypothetical protein VNQ73_16515 [Ilumatobacter sp.]|nr:hypothetical protein [Ilumatobacter sp.]